MLKSIKQSLLNNRNAIITFLLTLNAYISSELYANLVYVNLNSPGSQLTVSYNPGDTLRIITNEGGIKDSFDFIPGDGLITNYRFTQELLSTLSVGGKVTTIVVKLERLPVGPIPAHTILYDPVNGGELYRKLFPLSSWGSSSTSGFFSSSSVPNQTRYGIVRNPIILSVELTSFEGKMGDDSYPHLIRTTSSENNNKEFIIERSYDAITFEKIGHIPGSGTSYDLQQYQFTDSSFDRSNDNIYYRLLVVDMDNIITSGDMIFIKNTHSDQNSVIKEYIVHGVNVLIPGLLDYKLYSFNGMLLNQGTGPLVLLDNLPSGNYYIIDDNNRKAIRIIIQ